MEAELQQPGKLYFRNLDSIRFFAATMVFLQHGVAGSYQYLNIKGSTAERFLYTISNGGTGVSIFFVLSGFLITYLILSEIKLKGNFSLKNFYIRRMLRIWPLYFLVIIIAFIIFPVLAKLSKTPINQGASIWYQLIFMGNFDIMKIESLRPGTDILMQNITWSIAIEEQFYALWPLIFVFLPPKYILPTIVSVIAGSLVFRFYHSDNINILYFHTLSVIVDLGTGALFAYLIITRAKIRRFFERTNTWTILASFVLFFISMMYGDILFSSPIGSFLSRLYFALLFGFIIAGQSMITTPSILELGNISIAKKLGKYTYGIYLLHPIAIEIIHIISKKVLPGLDIFFAQIFMGIFSLFLTLIFSWLSYTYFEKPFLDFKNLFGSITKE